MLAWLIFILLTKETDFNPLGLLSSRSGSGALRLRFNFIDRARLAVPQGGAKNTPTTRGFFNQLASRSRPLLVVRSTRLTGATQFLGLMWSTPNDDAKLPEACCYSTSSAEDFYDQGFIDFLSIQALKAIQGRLCASLPWIWRLVIVMFSLWMRSMTTLPQAEVPSVIALGSIGYL